MKHFRQLIFVWVGTGLSFCQLSDKSPRSSMVGPETSDSQAEYTVTATIDGIRESAGPIILSLNGEEESPPITSNSSFTFQTKLPANSSYQVILVSHPETLNCRIENSFGEGISSHIDHVRVSCFYEVEKFLSGGMLGVDDFPLTIQLDNWKKKPQGSSEAEYLASFTQSWIYCPIINAALYKAGLRSETHLNPAVMADWERRIPHVFKALTDALAYNIKKEDPPLRFVDGNTLERTGGTRYVFDSPGHLTGPHQETFLDDYSPWDFMGEGISQDHIDSIENPQLRQYFIDAHILNALLGSSSYFLRSFLIESMQNVIINAP